MKRWVWFWVWIGSLGLASSAAWAQGPGLQVAEQMPANNWVRLEGLADPYPDWVELHNAGTEALNLKGYFLNDEPNYSDDPAQLPDTVLAPGARLVLVSSEVPGREGPWLTLPFRLSAGERLWLYSPEGVLVDVSPAACIISQQSLARDAGGAWVYNRQPSPGFDFVAVTAMPLITQRDTLSASLAGGFYPGAVQVSLAGRLPGVTLHYTLNGQMPDSSSPIYTGVLTLQPRSRDEPDFFAEKNSADNYVEPPRSVPKAVVLRAQAFIGSCPVSEVLIRTYFLGINPYHVPVVSVHVAQRDFWGNNRGIYVRGNNRAEGQANWNGRGRSWEREAYIEGYQPDNQAWIGRWAGVRIQGASSRAFPQKSLRLYARASLSPSGDSTFSAALFNDSIAYQRLVLRATYGSLNKSWMTDEVSHALVRPLRMQTQPSRTVLVFVNGEFWGYHHLRPLADERMLQDRLGLSRHQLDVINNWGELENGSSEAWTQTADLIYLAQNGNENARKNLLQEFDWGNLSDYYLAQIFLANQDWPKNNVRLYRPRQEGARWQFIYYDADYSYVDYQSPMLGPFLSPEFNRQPGYTLLHLFLQEPAFARQFSLRFLELLGTRFRPGPQLHIIDSLYHLMKPQAAEHSNRWSDLRLNDWHSNVDQLRRFAVLRGPYALQEWEQYLGSTLWQPYPNPSGGAPIRLTGQESQTEAWEVSVHDGMGRTVSQHSLAPGQTLATDTWPPGVYRLRIRWGPVQVWRTVVR